MLEISALSKTYYTSQKDNGVQALCDINLHLNEGSSLAIVGPSGCGKSSLLRLIAGLAEPTEGSISIFEELVKKPRKKTAFMLQDFGLLPWKNVEQNVGLALQLQGVSAGKRKEIIDKVLSSV
ncbi:MAG: ATP-binding cassette domain-containing protein, partial [Eggerthellaceae bacterium]|nr:ATP-binding cassette domain-containing protein [Eggerthellaceae bacterium]